MISSDVTILIVDDEPNNVLLLQMDLEDAGYENFLIARDGKEAWDILQERHEEIDLVLLDRMMPNMDGMQVMEEIKKHPEICHIPVIMQTAAAAKEQMLEGVAAGVYYYLTKPYDEDMMLAIVEAALHDYSSYKKMRQEMEKFRPKPHLIKVSHFRIQTPEDVECLVIFIAGLFPEPERILLGLSELFINAVEHGNLGITYEDKTRLLSEGKWDAEIERRLALPENAEKFADIFYERDDDQITLKIIDQGKGFDWEKYIEIDCDRATHNHGRGIAMANMLAFDTLEYQGAGNEVHCKVNIK